MKWKGGAYRSGSQIIRLDAFYHKKQEINGLWGGGGVGGGVGEDQNGFCDTRPFMKWREWGMLSQGTLKSFAKLYIHIYHTAKFKIIRPVVTENSSGQNCMPKRSLWVRHFEVWTPWYSLAQLHIHIYHIPSLPLVTVNLCGQNLDRKKEK